MLCFGAFSFSLMELRKTEHISVNPADAVYGHLLNLDFLNRKNIILLVIFLLIILHFFHIFIITCYHFFGDLLLIDLVKIKTPF